MIHRQACIIGSLDVGKVRLRRIMLKSHHFGVIFGGKTNFWTLKYLQIWPKKSFLMYSPPRGSTSRALDIYTFFMSGQHKIMDEEDDIDDDSHYCMTDAIIVAINFPSYRDSTDMIWTESILLQCS